MSAGTRARPAATLVVVALAVVFVVLLAHGAAGAVDATSVEPTPAPPIGEDESGSPTVFVILSLVGATVALAIIAVTWIRTRPH